MKVLIDGEEVECLNNVKVIYEEGDENGDELHVTLNGEGQVLDVVDPKGGVRKTYWALISHLAEECH
jgi:hypothetical protein